MNANRFISPAIPINCSTVTSLSQLGPVTRITITSQTMSTRRAALSVITSRTAGPAIARFSELYMLTFVKRRSLYRRSLKLALDWAVHRHLWRGQALYIRSLFEANRSVTDPRHQRVGSYGLVEGDTRADVVIQALLTETEKLLESWKHPDPYTPPTAPGGKFGQPANAVNFVEAIIDSNLQVRSTRETFHHLFLTVSICPVEPIALIVRNNMSAAPPHPVNRH